MHCVYAKMDALDDKISPAKDVGRQIASVCSTEAVAWGEEVANLSGHPERATELTLSLMDGEALAAQVMQHRTGHWLGAAP